MQMNKFFSLVVKHREFIITCFKVLYAILIVVTFIGGWSLYWVDDHAALFLDIGNKAGETALLLYILTLIPGIARRLQIRSKLISLLMIFRRYIGIAMFLFVWMHFWFERGVDWFLHGTLLSSSPVPFELMGFLAGSISLAFALTSNDWSTKKLGVWWGRLHALTYTLVWIIFLHVALQKISIWTVLIGGTAVLVLISHLYPRLKKR